MYSVNQNINFKKPKNAVSVQVRQNGKILQTIKAYNDITAAYPPFMYGLRERYETSSNSFFSRIALVLGTIDGAPFGENTLSPTDYTTVTNDYRNFVSPYAYNRTSDGWNTTTGTERNGTLEVKKGNDNGEFVAAVLQHEFTNVSDTIYNIFVAGAVGHGNVTYATKYVNWSVLCGYTLETPIAPNPGEPVDLLVTYECRASVPWGPTLSEDYVEQLTGGSFTLKEYDYTGAETDGDVISYSGGTGLMTMAKWNDLPNDGSTKVGNYLIRPLDDYYNKAIVDGEPVDTSKASGSFTIQDLSVTASSYSATLDMNLAVQEVYRESTPSRAITQLYNDNETNFVYFTTPITVDNTQKAQFTMPNKSITWTIS